MKALDDEETVVIATFSQWADAHIAMLKLESEGIESFIPDEHVIRLNLPFTYSQGVKLLVNRTDAFRAAAILRDSSEN